MVRLMNAKEKHSDFVGINSPLNNHKGYRALGARNYGYFNVDFYQDGQMYLARVSHVATDKKESKTTAF